MDPVKSPGVECSVGPHPNYLRGRGRTDREVAARNPCSEPRTAPLKEGTLTETYTHTYSIDTFSADRKAVPGPRHLADEDALAYLAQRMGDQHRGGLAPAYWEKRAGILLEEAARGPGVACIHPVARGRGLIVTAEPALAAALWKVEVFPLFEDDGDVGELCAAYDHPRLAVAMQEAGLRAEAWARIDSEEVRREDERGPLVGFEAQVTAHLAAPLLPGATAEAREALGERAFAPRRGCTLEHGASLSTSPAA
jgi:hypothetical protein